MGVVVVIRHSQAVANAQGILMGAKLDSPLNDYGRKLAKMKGQALRDEGFVPDRVYCSELTRAKQTATTILNELGIERDLIELSALNERDFGKYDGKPYKFVLEAFDTYGEDPPTIEPVALFIERVLKAFDQIKQQTQGSVLVVTHSNPVMVMQAAVTNPAGIQEYWKLGDPEYCEGFRFKMQL